jgi:predicted HTH domain antitoxin
MLKVEVTFPDSLFAALRKAPHEIGREVSIAASIHWYQQTAISMERAAEFAGMSRAEFLKELARRHVDVFVFDETADDLIEWVKASEGKGLGMRQRKR